MIEHIGPFKDGSYKVTQYSKLIPYITLFKTTKTIYFEMPGTSPISIDYEDEQESAMWLVFIADVMARVAGFTAFGSTKRINPFDTEVHGLDLAEVIRRE